MYNRLERFLLLSKAIIQHLWFYIVELPLLIRIPIGYASMKIIKDIRYGSKPSNTLDIYPVDSSSQENTKYPVLVFYYGGAWGR